MSYQDWIQDREKTLKLLEQFKVTRKSDRLEIVKNWHLAHSILVKSVSGWGNWLLNMAVVEVLDKKDLKEIYESYVDFVKGFVQLDIEVTKYLGEILSSVAEDKEEKTNQKGEQPKYIT